MSIKQKRCRYCRGLFTPDPRLKDQQIACGKVSCLKARKKEAQKKWLKKNPGYFKGRYPNTIEWLKKHPGYLKGYRQAHPEYVQKNRIKQEQRRHKQKQGHQTPNKPGVDIQDTTILQPVVSPEDSVRLVCVDIQDTISAQLIVPVGIRSISPYVDIQDDIDRVKCGGYPCSKRIAREDRLKRFITMAGGRWLGCMPKR